MTLKPPDPKYALPKDTDKYTADLTKLGSKEQSGMHRKWWTLDEWDGAKNPTASGVRRKLVELYGKVGFGFKVAVASDQSTTALMVRFDPSTIEQEKPHADPG